jgi:DNA-binding Lrp family transcriptional regulator
MSYLILGVEGVEKVYSVTGEYDLIITVRAGATSEFHSMIKEIRNLNGILSTKSFLVMQEFEKKVAKSNEIGEKPEEI